jgi:outer membrane murein-binding lipoprotein Lpp
MTDEELKAIEGKRHHGEHLAGCIDCRRADTDIATLVAEVRRLQGDAENARETLAAGERAYAALEERHSAVCAHYEAEVRRLKAALGEATAATLTWIPPDLARDAVVNGQDKTVPLFMILISTPGPLSSIIKILI